MARQSELGDGDRLDVRLAVVPRRPWLSAIVLLVVVVVAGLVGRWSMWAFVLLGACLVFGLGYQVWFSWSRNRAGPVMTLDADGVTVRGHPRLRWDDVDHLCVGSIAPDAGRLVRFLVGRRYGPVVAFVPKPGVVMPPPPGGGRDRSSWQQIRQARYGTNLTVVASTLTISTDQLIAAATRWGRLPVERR